MFWCLSGDWYLWFGICASACTPGQQAGEKYWSGGAEGLGRWETGLGKHLKIVSNPFAPVWLWNDSANSSRVMLTKLRTGFCLILWKREDLAESLDVCWELVSEGINACLSEKVCASCWMDVWSPTSTQHPSLHRKQRGCCTSDSRPTELFNATK